MCKKKCEHPERLKGKDPSECSEEQIKECHGEDATRKSHECEKDC